MKGKQVKHKRITWQRKEGYQINTKTDKRFSPFYCYIGDRNIETIYQCDIKGYDVGGTDYRVGKGKESINPNIDPFTGYLKLYRTWAKNNRELLNELFHKVIEHDYVLGDFFASSDTNQANALSIILNEVALGYKRISIIGSKSFKDYKTFKEFMDALKLDISVIHTSQGKGAESLAIRYANESNIPVSLYLPQTSIYGKKAETYKYFDMIKQSDEVVVLWDGESKEINDQLTIAKHEKKKTHLLMIDKKLTDKH